MTQFKKGDKVQLKKDFDYRESFINLYTAGPWVVRNVDRFGYLDLGKMGVWTPGWFALVPAQKEFTDEEYEALLV